MKTAQEIADFVGGTLQGDAAAPVSTVGSLTRARAGAFAYAEAKYWMEPEIELAKNYGYRDSDLRHIEELIVEHREVIRNAWERQFRG